MSVRLGGCVKKETSVIVLSNCEAKDGADQHMFTQGVKIKALDITFTGTELQKEEQLDKMSVVWSHNQKNPTKPIKLRKGVVIPPDTLIRSRFCDNMTYEIRIEVVPYKKPRRRLAPKTQP